MIIIKLKLCLATVLSGCFVLCYRSSPQQQHHLTPPSNRIQCGWSVKGTLTSWQIALSETSVLPFSQSHQKEKIMWKSATKIRTRQHCYW